MTRDLAVVYQGALDLKSVLLEDAITERRDGLETLVKMRANGTLPQDYEEWIPVFRKSLGLPGEN